MLPKKIPMIKRKKTKVVAKKNPSPKKLHYQILNSLRRLSSYYPARLEAKAGAKVAPTLYGCEQCKTLMYEGTSDKKLKEYQAKFPKYKVLKGRIEIDHLVPVVGEEGFVDYNTYIERLFCEKENLRPLCPSCHSKKSIKENKERK